MNQEKFAQNLEQAKIELKQLQTEIYHTAEAEEEKEELWKTQLPLIETAIDQLTAEESKSSNSIFFVLHVPTYTKTWPIFLFYLENNPSDEEEEDTEQEEIDIKETFDKIQNYILKDKCRKAVKYLKKLFKHSGFAKEMKNLSEETKKEALLLFMYKIFMNSTPKKNNEENGEEAPQQAKKTLTTDQEEIKKLDTIKVKKKLVEYLQVHSLSYPRSPWFLIE